MQRIVFFIILIFFQTSGAQILDFATTTKVKEVSAAEFQIKKMGETLEIKKGETYLVIPENQIPILVLSASASSQKVKISANDFTNTFGDIIDFKVQDSVNAITSEIKKIEVLLKKKDLSGAQGRIASLKLKYPRVSQVLFLSASVNYLSQNSVMAIEELKRGLSIDPQDETAIQLLKKIEGQKSL